MRALLLMGLLMGLLMVPACAPVGTGRSPMPAEQPAGPAEIPPDMAGEWLVQPGDGSFPEVWTVKQVGLTITGTIVFDPTAIPAGFANSKRSLLGQLQPSGQGWLATMQTPDGYLQLQDDFRFDFCTRRTGAQKLSARPQARGPGTGEFTGWYALAPGSAKAAVPLPHPWRAGQRRLRPVCAPYLNRYTPPVLWSST